MIRSPGLRSPTVHFLRDPHSLVYNFPPSLERIPPREKFAANRLPGYVTASQDTVRRLLLHGFLCGVLAD